MKSIAGLLGLGFILFVLIRLAITHVASPLIHRKDDRKREREAEKSVRSFLTATYPESSTSSDHATFTHGGMACSLKWRRSPPRELDPCAQERTTLSIQIPDWMAQALSGGELTIDGGMPAQYDGVLKSSPPKEYSDFIEGRMEGGVPGVPFVNAKSGNKALQDSLQHDLEIHRIFEELKRKHGDWFSPCFTLKERRFSVEVQTLVRSEATASDLVMGTLQALKRVYLAACQVEGVQPAEREAMDPVFGASDRFLERPVAVFGDAGTSWDRPDETIGGEGGDGGRGRMDDGMTAARISRYS